MMPPSSSTNKSCFLLVTALADRFNFTLVLTRPRALIHFSLGHHLSGQTALSGLLEMSDIYVPRPRVDSRFSDLGDFVISFSSCLD